MSQILKNNLIILACLLLSLNIYAKDSKFGTGLLFQDKSVYDAYPKVQKYRAFLPPKADLSQFMPSIQSQGKISSCAAWTTNYSMRTYYANKDGKSSVYSPSYSYDYFVKGDCKRGTYLVDMLDFMKYNGSLPIQDYPVKQTSCTPMPNFNALKSIAKNHLIESWTAINPEDLDTIKGKIHQGHPVAGGFFIAEAMDNYKGGIYHSGSILDWTPPKNTTDPHPIDTSGLNFTGHAMTIVGYDDEKKAFKIMNSWGKDWGEEGYMWFDYASLKNRLYEAYVFKVAYNKPDPEPTPEPTPEPVKKQTEKEIQEIISNLSLGYDCSWIESKISQKTIMLSGVMQTKEDKSALAKMVNNTFKNYKIKSSIEVRTWPTCELALTTYAIEKNLKKNVALKTMKKVYRGGDELDVKIKVKTFTTGYLNIFYLQANGTAVLISSDHKIKSKKSFTLSSLRDEEVLEISAPFGNEAIIAVLVKNKNLLALGPTILDDREFLTQLRIKLNDLSESNDLLSVSTIFIETKE